MNKIALRLIILGVVFLGALVTFSVWINKENKEMASGMAEASFPVIHFLYEDTDINEIHGYVNEMNLGTMRDAVTPIDASNQLHLEISSPEREIENIAYEIRSIEEDHLLVNNNKTDFVIKGDVISCDITLPSLFEGNTEYNMVITLATDKGEIYYYTRLIDPKGCNLEESLSFAMQFHEYTFREDADTFIPTYMDMATGDATTLSYVDLSCTLGQITWGKFEGTRLTEPIASIEEVSGAYNVILLQYVVTSVNENREVEYYNVEEYYRLKKAPNRMYVLNFERRMNEIFRVENTFLRNNSAIILGIRDPEVEFKTNEAGDSIAFVQEGDLWSYNRSNNTIYQVFSFRGLESINMKENWNQHDIKIIKVDEAGSVDFAVYGYMNRGNHEGKVGIGIYHYDGISHMVEEEIFISSTKSYDALKAELGDLFYVNEQKILYLVLQETFYRIDLTTHEVTKVLENLEDFEYAVSESNRYMAWIDCAEGENSSSIHLEDLKTGISYEVKDEEGTYLRPLEFLGEDFIYGIAKAEHVKIDASGRDVFPMSSLKIMNTYEAQKEVIKTYTPISGYIEMITLENNSIYIDLIKETEGRFVSGGKDIIMNRETENVGDVGLSTMVTEKKQREILITMKSNNSNHKLESIISSYIQKDEEQTKLSLDDFSKKMYYVYFKGESIFASSHVWEAIRVANEVKGVVVDADRNYVWMRARSTTKSAMKNLAFHEADASGSSIVKAVSAILAFEGKSIGVGDLMAAGQTPLEVLEKTLPEAFVYEIYECKSDDLLYFIDQGTPVMAYIEKDKAILLTGYSQSNLYYYNPATNSEGSMSLEDADAKFALGGLRYVVYIK
jgi:hypothetical protein